MFAAVTSDTWGTFVLFAWRDSSGCIYGVAGICAAPVVAEVLVQCFLAVEAGGGVQVAGARLWLKDVD